MRYSSRLFVLFTIVLVVLTACFAGSPAATDSPVPPIDTTNAVSLPTLAPTTAPDDNAQGGMSAADMHPLSIASLRGRVYEGSDFVMEQTLDAGVNYDRYLVSYLSDGLKIYAMLTVPRAERPPTGFPVIIFNHGYIPPDEYRTTERYVAYLDAFARSGYIVVKSDYRGHGFSEGNPAGAYTSPDYTIDVLNAVAAARRYPAADPNRIGMWGHSMGGYITLRAMVADQGIRAGVIWAGVVASYEELFRSWFRSPSPNRSGWRSSMVEHYSTPDDNPAFWNALSANSFVDELTGPIQIHHGTGDTTVPYSYSVLLDEQIRAVGGDVELYLYERDDHNIAANRDGALALSVVFFNQWVAGLY